MSGSTEDLKKHLKEEIAKSGFPLEIKIATLLNQNDWNVTPHLLYPLKGTDKELDIWATRKVEKKAQQVLIIECKKQKNKPWIFFEQDEPNSEVFSLNASPLYLYDQLGKFFRESHYSKVKPCSYHFPSFVKKRKGDPILEAINQVLNALIFCFDIETAMYEKLVNKKFTFLYPIIVLDGKLFSAKVQPSGEIELTESSHLQLKVIRALKEPMVVKGRKGSYVMAIKPFIIDIVLQDYFQEFLKVFS